MTVVILCGGEGYRYRNIYNDLPKALAPIGNMPILWHHFKYFEQYGFRRFILCLGHKADQIRNYVDTIKHDDWEILCVETGKSTPTGGRIKKIEPYLDGEKEFLATYVDGLSDIDLSALLTFSKQAGKIATLTAIRPNSQYGILDISSDDTVTGFDEKPPLPFYINGGFFVFRKSIFDYLGENDALEVETFHKLVDISQLSAFKHHGYWKCMDTFKDNIELDLKWQDGTAPWKRW